MEEQWKTIYINNEKTNYEISNSGLCRNVNKLNWKTGGLLKPKFNKQNGYNSYCLVLNGINHYKYAHRLVAESFVEHSIKERVFINHIDGVKTNNDFRNLEWCTREENMKHCFDNDLCSTAKPILQYDLYGNFIKEYKSTAVASIELNINAKTISQCLRNISKSAYNFQWKFKDDNRTVKNISKIFKRQSSGVYQLSLEGNVIEYFEKITLAYEKLNKIDNGAISLACKGKQKTAFGYKWKYEFEI